MTSFASGKYVNQLIGKKVVIFGGTSGIGLAVTQGVLEEGCNVIIGSSNEEKVQHTIQQLRNGHYQIKTTDSTRISGYPINLGAGEQTEVNLKHFFEKVGKVDHIVYSAGDSVSIQPLQQIDYNQILKAGQIRFFSAILLAKVGSNYLNDGGSFIFTSGSASLRPKPDWSIVAGFAAGIHGFVRALAVDLASRNIRVNAVSPGPIDTELVSNMPEEKRKTLLHLHQQWSLTGRLGRPQDIAQTYIYLMKDNNITGENISSDSGLKYGLGSD